MKEENDSERMHFQTVDRQMIINQLEAIKILESTIRNEVIDIQVSYTLYFNTVSVIW